MINFRKTLSSFLAVLFIGTSLASCAEVKPTSSSKSSSDRIDTLLSSVSDKIVYGTADDALAFGIDMSSFRNDGYIIRTENGSTVIFGKTEDALDRAAHKFVKAFANETDVNYVIGEGYPVKALTICGVPVSEFTVSLSISEDGYGFSDCAEFAQDEVVTYIEQTTGVKLKKGNSEHEIKLVQMEKDNALGIDGFRIVTEGGNLVIYGGYKRGIMYGFYEVLERYLGWRFLGADEGMTYCTPAESIDLDGIEYEYVPVFFERGERDGAKKTSYAPGSFTSDSVYDYTIKRKLNGSVGLSLTSGTYGWSEGRNTTVHTFKDQLPDVCDATKQPCLTDEINIEDCADSVIKTIDAFKEAGLTEGVDMFPVCIGPNDNLEYCKCKNCTKAIQKGGGTQAATLIPFINAVIEIADEVYPDVTYATIAYQEGIKAPTICVPNEKLNIIFCLIQKCMAHSLYDTDCHCEDSNTYLINNMTFAEYLDDWCKLSENMGVWYYPTNFENALCPLALDRVVREDIRYFAEHGVNTFTCENYSNGTGFDFLNAYIISKLLWNPYMDDAEYNSMINEYMEAYYGEGWENIRAYYDMMQRSGETRVCFAGFASWPEEQVDMLMYDVKYEEILDLFDEAKALVDSTAQYERIERLELHVHYLHLCSVYSEEYLHGTDEQKKAYEDLYRYIYDTMFAIGYKQDLLGNKRPKEFTLNENPSVQWGYGMAVTCSKNRFEYN